MTRPTRHKDTGIYQFRKRVPEHLKLILGKTEEKISLGTRDPGEAKLAHMRVSVEVEKRWRQLGHGALSLTHKQAVAMSGEIYQEFVRRHEHAPHKAALTLAMLAAGQAKPGSVKVIIGGAKPEKTQALYERMLLKVTNPPEIDLYLKEKGIILDAESREAVRKEVLLSLSQARDLVYRYAFKSDYSPDPRANRFPQLEIDSPMEKMGSAPESIGKFALLQIYLDYANEKKISPATVKRWRPIIELVAKDVPDARDLTPTWCVEWKDKLLKSGLAHGTVKNAYLASLSAVCSWGVANLRLAANPLANITVSIPKVQKVRERHFNKDEIGTILRATFETPPQALSASMRAARRWVPWLCAYTGARVGEIAQIRKSDIKFDDGFWLIRITPEAGSTKNGNARYVAIHEHLIEQGFLEFVQSHQADTALFINATRRRNGSAQNPQSKKVGERLAKWVRKLGVDDVSILPNHAWRHLFKSRARRVRMDVGCRDYMQGHVPATEGEAYGEFEPDVLAHEIAKLPRFEL